MKTWAALILCCRMGESRGTGEMDTFSIVSHIFLHLFLFVPLLYKDGVLKNKCTVNFLKSFHSFHSYMVPIGQLGWFLKNRSNVNFVKKKNDWKRRKSNIYWIPTICTTLCCSFKQSIFFNLHNNTWGRDSPGGPVVKNPPCNAGNVCLIPGEGARIP